MSRILSIITCVFLSAIGSESARILAVYPVPSISHQVVFRPVMLELAKRGHDVTVVTPDPIFPKGKAPSNYTEIDVHDISYKPWNKFVEISSAKDSSLANQIKIAMELLTDIFEKQVKTPEVQKILRDKHKFDLLFVEACTAIALSLSHVIKVPTIQFSSFGALPGMYESVGAPTHLFKYPLPIRQNFLNLSVWQQLSEYRTYREVENILLDQEEIVHVELKRIFGSDMPSVHELRRNVDMMFLNIYPIWDFNRPVPPNVIYLGGLHQNPRKDLPKELKSFLDSATDGVIYMSLGTNVKPSNLPIEKVNMFLKVFSTLPYKVLWKWDQDELEGRSDNVRISKWFPQSDLLQHPSIKLFITQGGLQSTDEAITAGVPFVGIPILGDQWFNTELYVYHKIGVKLDIATVTEADFKNAINTVLNDGSYRANIVRLRKLMRDQPQPPVERAVWWTEHVLRHGGAKHLRAPAADMSWTEYYEVKLLSVVFGVLALLLTAIVMTVRLVIRSVSKDKLKKN
ncbi:UDP-glycosyltransferase UGT5-like [Epargyreus clarus]|uniref:UDP-glycosyltransferase UGT5-like n=1 Tax=Epargyreus clarus TaxID=520877 RepID=UPI003C2FA0FB